jgi:hypothetical protein
VALRAQSQGNKNSYPDFVLVSLEKKKVLETLKTTTSLTYLAFVNLDVPRKGN